MPGLRCDRAHWRAARALPAPLEEARALEGTGRSNLSHNRREAEADLQRALEIYLRLGAPDTQRIQKALGELASIESPSPT
jgi:hypothetical protein